MTVHALGSLHMLCHPHSFERQPATKCPVTPLDWRCEKKRWWHRSWNVLVRARACVCAFACVHASRLTSILRFAWRILASYRDRTEAEMRTNKSYSKQLHKVGTFCKGHILQRKHTATDTYCNGHVLQRTHTANKCPSKSIHLQCSEMITMQASCRNEYRLITLLVPLCHLTWTAQSHLEATKSETNHEGIESSLHTTQTDLQLSASPEI